MRVTLGTAVALLALASVAAAHGVSAPAVPDERIFSPWDQAALGGLIVAGCLYLRGCRELRARGVRVSPGRQTAFAGGWTTLVVAVLPWMDAAAITTFAAHMMQHELMMLVGAPLVMAGRPLSISLWSLPEQWRRRVATPLQHRAGARALRMFTTPVIAWGLHGAVVWAWHLPALFEWAVRNEAAHAVQHAMFVTTSILFWWGLLYGRYGRAGYGAAVFYVFTTAVHTGILGALFTFAGRPFYTVYVTASATAGNALADQQRAGLLMWIPSGMLLTMLGVALFAAWLGEAERRERSSLRLESNRRWSREPDDDSPPDANAVGHYDAAPPLRARR